MAGHSERPTAAEHSVLMRAISMLLAASEMRFWMLQSVINAVFSCSWQVCMPSDLAYAMYE